MSNFDDFNARYELQRKAQAQANELNKAVLFDVLVKAGITRVFVDFDGEGDEGQIGDIGAHAGDANTELPPVSVGMHKVQCNSDALTASQASLSEAVETLCYAYLEQEHDGWENDGGAFGTFEFDVGKRSIRLDFNERFVDHTHCEHQF